MGWSSVGKTGLPLSRFADDDSPAVWDEMSTERPLATVSLV